MASAETSWMPTSGRHEVKVGSSLTRALKARQDPGSTMPQSDTMPAKRPPSLRDFYSFRYNFKPPSVDTSRPGTIELNRGKETTTVSVEHPSTQEGERFSFIGTEEPAKEFDCVLIYNEENGEFVLEKLDSCVALKYEKKTASSSRPRPSASPLPPTPVAPPTSIGPIDDLEAELEGILGDKDADGDTDEPLEDVLPGPSTRAQPVIAPPPKPASLPPPPKRAPPKAKPNTKLRSQVPPPKLKPPQAKSKQVAQSKPQPLPPPPPPPAVYADEEVFDLGTPSLTAKQKAQTSSAPSGGLALPGSTSTFIPPPAPASAPDPPPAADSDEDSEDWEPVATVPPIQPHADIVDAEEEEVDIDLNDLEAEIYEQLGAEDEEMSEPESQPAKGAPISMREFAETNGLEGYDEDDYTSSDDTDDD